jgi:hypothetical protein
MNLTSVSLGTNVNYIGTMAFQNCQSLTNITFPNSLVSIGFLAFFHCKNLVNISIPNSVTTIGLNAFDSCFSLTSITIPSSVTFLGCSAFNNCSNLASIYFKGNLPSTTGDPLSGANLATCYYLPGTIGWSSTFLGQPTLLWNPTIQTAGASFGIRTNRFGFNITGTSGLTVIVEASTNPINSAWIPVATNTIAGGSSYFNDSKWTNYPSRFYRFRSP